MLEVIMVIFFNIKKINKCLKVIEKSSGFQILELPLVLILSVNYMFCLIFAYSVHKLCAKLKI